MNPFDEPLGGGDELPRMEVVEDGAPGSLPRLSIVHLLMWMAATAVAFAPLAWRNPAASLSNAARSSAATVSLSVHGLAAGTYLFVVAAILLWRRRGHRARFEPGHWLALKGAAAWFQSLVLYAVVFSAPPEMMIVWYVQGLRLLVGSAFFVLFTWLTFRSGEQPRWRLTYATFALAPLIGEFAGMVLMAAGSGRTPLLHMAGHAGAYAIQAGVLLFAVTQDRAHGTPRHWTHWLAAVVYLISLAASTLIYAVYFMFPQMLQAQ